MYFLLRDAILTKSIKVEYARDLRQQLFPPSQVRLQSPLYYLLSYNLSAYVQQSIVIPRFLRSQLTKDRINRNVFKKLIDNREGNNLVDYIVITYAKITKSNSILISYYILKDNRTIIHRYIIIARYIFNYLANIVSFKGCLRSVAGSIAGSVVGGASSSNTPNDPLVEPTGHSNIIKRPTIYITIYYPTIAKEYVILLNINALTSEDLYRFIVSLLFICF